MVVNEFGGQRAPFFFFVFQSVAMIFYFFQRVSMIKMKVTVV